MDFDQQGFVSRKAIFHDLEFHRQYSTQVTLEVQVESVVRPVNLFSGVEEQVSVAGVRKAPTVEILDGDPEQVLAAVDVLLSSNHVRYEIKNP